VGTKSFGKSDGGLLSFASSFTLLQFPRVPFWSIFQKSCKTPFKDQQVYATTAVQRLSTQSEQKRIP
jgi:hypothetical protein